MIFLFWTLNLFLKPGLIVALNNVESTLFENPCKVISYYRQYVYNDGIQKHSNFIKLQTDTKNSFKSKKVLKLDPKLHRKIVIWAFCGFALIFYINKKNPIVSGYFLLRHSQS